MRYGSVCSGIEAASVAWEPLGFVPAWFAEVEPFPSAVLAHHWPQVENLGDMTKIAAAVLRGTVEAPELLVGGTPCQAFSVAGMRKGLEDERGQLTIKYVELLNAIDLVRTRNGEQPAACVWENVPGVLSDKGNAFGCFLGALAGEDCELQPAGKRWADAGCVYGPQRAIAWRVLDAQYFGVAQRRRRVFVVASAREDFDPAAVLFERESVRRDSAPRREAGQETATAAGVRTFAGNVEQPIASTLQTTSHDWSRADGFNVAVQAFPAELSGTQSATAENLSPALSVKHTTAVAFAQNSRDELREMPYAGALAANPGMKQTSYVRDGLAVRRLTPEECEKLQGFPVNHTRIPWRNNAAEDCPDGPRYKAIGNSKAVPVVRWIGRRLQQETAGGACA